MIWGGSRTARGLGTWNERIITQPQDVVSQDSCTKSFDHISREYLLSVVTNGESAWTRSCCSAQALHQDVDAGYR